MSLPILICAFVILAIGLAVFYWAGRSNDRFYVTNLVAWLLIALFPVFLLFSAFPNPGNVNVEVFGTSATGAVALFIFIWVYGNRSATKAVSIDTLKAQIKSVETQLEACKKAPRVAGEKDERVVLTETRTYPYILKRRSHKKVVLITGNIENVKGVDAWVSSENTNMQMARFYDRSVSGTVRYLGARRDQLGRVTDDIIAKELSNQMGGESYVQPTTVIVTGAGELEQSHGVKRIFHVAAVQGQVASGYKPVDNIEQCVTRSLQRADSEEFNALNLRSILFPLLGTGTAKGKLEEAAGRLLAAAIQYLETQKNGGVDEVCFLTWTDAELDACRAILNRSDRVAAATGAAG